MESSSEAANRRLSDRGSPIPPRQTWYCSEALETNRADGATSSIHGGRTPADGSGWRAYRPKRCSIMCASGSCSRLPAAATTMFGPT